MSYDGKIPPGGGVNPTTKAKLREQTDTRKVKGKFEASGGSRNVSVKEGKTHIPAATDNRPKERPLDDWEVKIQEAERLFFSKAADILTKDVSSAEKNHLREELKTLHTCMAELLTEYSQRMSDLTTNDRILEKHHQQIKSPMIRVFLTVKDELIKLEKSLAPNASKAAKQEVKNALPIAKSLIEQANKILAEAKALLVASTLPELPELTEVKVHPLPRPVSNERKESVKQAQKKRPRFLRKKEPETIAPVETVSPEQRLQNLKQKLQKGSPEHVQVILQHMIEVLETLGKQIDEHLAGKPEEKLKTERKQIFIRALNAIRQISKTEVTPATVSRVRQEMRDQVWLCEKCIQDITGWQGKVSAKRVTEPTPPQALKKATNAHLAASEIHFEPLHQQVEALNAATSPSAQKQVLRGMDHYIQAQREQFNRLLPLLQAVATKCDFEHREPPPECARFYEAMGHLNKALVTINKRTLSEEYFAAVKEADAALAVLDKFDQELPAPLWHDLTESVAQPDKATPHFLNLMCRRILNEETGPLSKRASLQKFTDICTYLEKVQGGKLDENTDAETIQAFRKVVGDGFSSPEKVRALMGQARTLEEVRAVGFQLVNWNDMQYGYLDQMCKKLDAVAMDLELAGIREGWDKLNTLTRNFTSGTETVAGRESASRLSRLETEVKSAVELIVKERVENPGFITQFRGDTKVCEKLQHELSQELGAVASIKLTPGSSPGEVVRSVEVKLGDAEQESKKINATLNGKGKYATRLRERLLAGDAKELLDVDKGKNTCHWDPHPKAMIRRFADDFVSSFEQYQKAVDLARKHENHINRLITARQRTESELEKVKNAIPTVRQLQITASRRSQKARVTENLRQLTTLVAGLKGKPLKRLSEETTPIRNLVVDMVKTQQLNADEAIELLDPLYTMKQTATGTTPALQVRTQPLSPKKAQRTETLKIALDEMDKKYRWTNLWHRLTRKKRLQAVENARSLVAICEACPQAPVANAQMLDSFIDELKKVEGSHPDYKRLANGLREYALHLQKSSTPITYEQARG